MKIIKVQEERGAICRSHLEALPKWFGIRNAVEDYIRESETQPMLACVREERPIGMLTMIEHSQMNLEIAVMGVLPEFHRKGVGAALIDATKKYGISRGIKMLSVKTLGERNLDSNYAETRAFYHAMGFEFFEELPDLWGENNPCALFVLPLTTLG